MLVSSPIVYYDGGNFTVIKEFFTAHNGAIPGVLILTGLLDNVLSQFFWAWGVLHTSPTVATIGLSLTIPLSILSDLTISAEPVCFAQYVAAVLVCGGFFVLTLNEEDGSSGGENSGESNGTVTENNDKRVAIESGANISLEAGFANSNINTNEKRTEGLRAGLLENHAGS